MGAAIFRDWRPHGIRFGEMCVISVGAVCGACRDFLLGEDLMFYVLRDQYNALVRVEAQAFAEAD